MRVKELRKEQRTTAAQARRDQDDMKAKRWIFANWPVDDWHEIAHAIRDGVNAECLLRDNREYQIPMDGKLYDDDPTLDPATGNTKLPPMKVDPRRMGQKHGHREVRLESRRRLHTLALQRPEPSKFFELQQAIGEDDGKDADGQWLCNRCVPEQDRTAEDFPDGSGFDERLPKWMPVAATPEPAELVGSETAAPNVAQVPPQAFQPTANGCSECGGAQYGKGFRHVEGCSKSTVRKKATA